MARDKIAIDAWASWIPTGTFEKWPKEFIPIFQKYGSLSLFQQGLSLEQMVEEMDRSGVEMVLLSAFGYGTVEIVTNEMCAQAVKRFPKRFIGVGTIDPRERPIKVCDKVKYLVDELGLKAVRLEPYAYGNGMAGAPPNEKMYWPIYIKCVEYKIPVCIQVGHTGPCMPSECGRPIYLDEVALSFPDLTIIGCHLGQPWHEEMMILAWKHQNVYVETSARTPKHWPEPFVKFASSWGSEKVLWATDYPLLSFDRTLSELEELNLPSQSFINIVRNNAIRAFHLEAPIK